MVPVLSSRSVVTSPAASTARPDIARTLRWTRRSMHAIPIALSRAPMDVGMRQTRSATSTGMLNDDAAYEEIGFTVSTTTTKKNDRERKSAVKDKRGKVRVDTGGKHIIKKNKARH